MIIVEIVNIGIDIRLIPITIVIRDQTPKTINNVGHNIVINSHPTKGVHWFLVINRDNTKSYYFDRFGVETMPTFLLKIIN